MKIQRDQVGGGGGDTWEMFLSDSRPSAHQAHAAKLIPQMVPPPPTTKCLTAESSWGPGSAQQRAPRSVHLKGQGKTASVSLQASAWPGCPRLEDRLVRDCGSRGNTEPLQAAYVSREAGQVPAHRPAVVDHAPSPD